MLSNKVKQTIVGLFNEADVRVNGERPWDIRLHNPAFYASVLSGGSMALGESYMDKWWDCTALDEFFHKILSADLDEKVIDYKAFLLKILKTKAINSQGRKMSFRSGQRHYDIGNELYEQMLDGRMIYSCAYWGPGVETLDEAQEAKLSLIARKLGLRGGMDVLDIGCGWGGTAEYLARAHGARVEGITVSGEQARLAERTCEGLPVKISVKDYRDIGKDEKFDRVVSVGMFEHVGPKNYRTYMKVAHNALKDGGLFLLQTIGNTMKSSTIDPWLEKHIFPNAKIPSEGQIIDAAEGLFIMEDWHNFGPDYDKTLMAWHDRFAEGWESISATRDEDGNLKYDERFRRRWEYYLLCCAGSFRARKNQLWQIVLSKKPSGSYRSIR